MISHQKISGKHLEKEAIIYIRQSTIKQVLKNKESQAYQLELRNRALELGWMKKDIRIIDSDLGMSGSSSEGRKGFEKIVSDISLSRVGIVFGYEVSRLARNCADWYKLIDLCSIFGTLIGDADGIYNPVDYNDRLLLGLKGTMSEAELHIIRNRLITGKLNKVKRGDLAQHIPVGYVRDKYLGVIKDPDQQVQKTIELIFTQFDNLGSCMKVVKFFKANSIFVPKKPVSGINIGELLWKEPSDHAVRSVLLNPIYAGAFVHGRKQLVPEKKKPGHPYSGIELKRQDEWISLVKDKYPSYISWEKYSKNQERLKENYNNYIGPNPLKGVERNGQGLLQGISFCGDCGCKLVMTYKREHRYNCSSMARTYADKRCFSINGKLIDKEVEKAFFQALEPAQLDLLSGVIKKENEERQKVFQHWDQRIERLDYEEKISRKRYKSVDPENRLVAGELEKEWESKLSELMNTKKEFEEFKIQKKIMVLEPELEARLRTLSENLPKLWYSGKLSNEQKKRLIRSLIDKVIIKKLSYGDIELRVVWVSSHYSVLNIRSAVRNTEEMRSYSEIIEKIKELTAKGLSLAEIATKLNAMNFKTARLEDFTAWHISKMKTKNKIYSSKIIKEKLAEKYPGSFTTSEVAKILNTTRKIIDQAIRRKVINPLKDPEVGLYIIFPKQIKILKKSL